jgi:hypothetical protein
MSIARASHSRHAPAKLQPRLRRDQAELYQWLEDELDEASFAVASELCDHYLSLAERLDQAPPRFERPVLEQALRQQVPDIHPSKRWLIDIPVDLAPGQRIAVGRVMRVLAELS